jgi:hypothetical protein
MLLAISPAYARHKNWQEKEAPRGRIGGLGNRCSIQLSYGDVASGRFQRSLRLTKNAGQEVSLLFTKPVIAGKCVSNTR